MLKFFHRHVITKEHVDMLKTSLKVYVTDKIVNYNGNFIEHSAMEKGILIRERDSEILKLIEGHLEPWLDPWQVLQMQISNGSWMDYSFDRLPVKLRQYMTKLDSLFFERWMSSVKYRPSADDYDVREQRLLEMMPDFTEDEYERYVLLGHSIPTSLGKKARDSARRAYRTVNEIIRSNVDKFSHFITLTVASEDKKHRHLQLNAERAEGEEEVLFDYIDGRDFEEVKKRYTSAMKNLANRLKRKGIPLEYIAVWELQTNGNVHFHILSTRIPKEELYKVPKWLDFNHLEQKRNNADGLIQWKHGKSDVQEIKNKARLTTYVSKYIIKSFQNVQEETYNTYLNKKKYFVTTGLERPTVEYLSDREQVDQIKRDLIGVEQEKEPFVKEYINPYNKGLITKSHYTKII